MLMGRPSKMTDLVVKKLEEAFALGCTDLEACFYADITKQTLYTYQQTHSEFLDRKELLKQRPVLEARQSVIKHLKDNGALALRYLERKQSSEFSTKPHESVDVEKENLKKLRELSDDELHEYIIDTLRQSELGRKYIRDEYLI